MPPRQPIVAAIPELSAYREQTGIGRVLHNLCMLWGDRVRPVDATFRASPLPVLRNLPFAVAPREPADLVLLPRLTGAQALRNTAALPSLAIVHDIGIVDFSGDRAGISRLTWQSILHGFRGLRHATAIVAVSQFSRDRLVAYLPTVAERVRVVPNGIAATFLEHRRNREESRRLVERALGHSLGAPILLYVGSELPRKNIPLLLRAFGELKARHPQAQLIKVGVAGQPRWRALTLRLCNELGLRPDVDVVLLDKVEDVLLADLYRAADLFVSASLYEGFGLPALESLAVGTPVVVTNRGAFPEVVGQVGWIAEPDLEGLTRVIIAALADSDREGRSRAGRAHARAYSWPCAADAYLGIMREICSPIADPAVQPSRVVA